MKLVIEYPKSNEKGVLRYIRNSALFNEILTNQGNHTVDDIDEAYKWLLSIVKEPEDREEAYKMLMDLSASELADLFKELTIAIEPDPNSPQNSEDG